MKSPKFSRAFLLAASVVIAPFAYSATLPIDVVDGDEGTGNMLTTDGGSNYQFGSVDRSTIYTNFYTEGGAGSGGGAGLGGVFFVDQGVSLTLTNVNFKSNTVKGGEAGSNPPKVIGGFEIALFEKKSSVGEIPALNVKPTLSKVGSDYVFNTVTLSSANKLIKTGSIADFGDNYAQNSISSVSETTVQFANSITVPTSDVTSSASGTLTSGTKTITVSALSNYTASDFAYGSTVVGTGIPVGAVVQEVVLDADNKVIGVKIDQAATASGPVSFDSVDMSKFSVSQFQPGTSSNQIILNASGMGLVVGMTLTGDGIPADTKITAINGNTVTLSSAINSLGFDAALPVGAVGSTTLQLASPDSRLVVGMSLKGEGFGPNTTVTAVAPDGTVTLSTALTAIPESATASAVLGVSGNNISLISAAGLSVGLELIGDGIPEGTKITAVNGNSITVSNAPTGELTSLQAVSTLRKGGSLNGITGDAAGANGRNGFSGRAGSAWLNEGEGQDGTNGYFATEGNGGVGGDGGNGGNGSGGLAYNNSLNKSIVDSTFSIIADTVEAQSAFTDVPVPKIPEGMFKVTAVVLESVNLAESIANLVLWSIDLNNGLVTRGGAGGDGGEGGAGDEFFGGGAGGAGGNGGAGGLSHVDGGDGGTGGKGGAGGFGAGGGLGGGAGEAGPTGQGTGGDAGDGGDAGFGAGAGSRGDNLYGQGGSGLGGAIFVRAGGTLNITGDTLFENNTSLAGSSNNQGSSGQTGGTDLFVMKGADVLLAPGHDHTIRFEGTIGDDSQGTLDGAANASGAGAEIRIGVGGLVQFAGENTFTGNTRIEGATLEADDGFGIHVDSHILFAGAGTNGNMLARNGNAGVLLTSGEFVRRVGTLSHQVSWTGAGGFASASEDGLKLNFGALTSTTGQTLFWNSSGISDNAVLVFGSDFSQGSVTLINSINLNTKTGRVVSYGDATEASGTVILSGAITNGDFDIGSLGYDGAVYLTGLNSITNLRVRSGVVSTQGGGRLFSSSVGGNINVTGGSVTLQGAEKINSLSVSAGASLAAAGAIEGTSLDNSGVLSYLGGATYTGTVTNRSGAVLNLLSNMTGVTTFDNNAGAITNLSANLSADQLIQNGAFDVIGDRANNDRTLTLSTGLSGSGAINLIKVNFDDSQLPASIESGLIINQSGNTTYAGTIGGGGIVTKSGSGELSLTGDSAFDGGLAISAGTLTHSGGSLSNNLAISVASGARFNARQADTYGSLSVANGGRTDIEANLSFTNGLANSGTTNITRTGTTTLVVGSGLSGENTGVINVQDGSGNLVISQNSNSRYSGSIVGIGEFTKDGTGTLTLAGSANSLDLAQGITVNNGILALDGAGILAADLDILINTNGTLKLVSGDQTANSLAGTGTIDLGVNNRLTIAVGGDFFGNVLGNGVLDIAGGNFTVSNSVTSSNGTFNVASGATTTIAQGADLTFPEINIETGGKLDVVGAVDANSTTVEGGSELHLGNSNGTQGGAVTSNTTEVLGTVSGVGSFTGDVNFLAGSKLKPGNSPGVISFVNLTLGSGSATTMEVEGNAGAGVAGGHDQNQVSGLLTLSSGSSLIITNSTAYELGLADTIKIFSFNPGAVSGNFSNASQSGFANEVIYNLATGNVVGMGASGHAAFLTALAPDVNQQRMLSALLVETAGGVEQYYGGKLMERLASAVSTSADTDRVFSLASPERHVALFDNVRSSMFASMMNLPSDGREGWNYRYTNRNQKSIVDGTYSEYRIASNSGSVDYTHKLAGSFVSATVGYDNGRTSGTGYRADSDGLTLAVAWSLPVASVKGLTLGLQSGMSSFTNDVSRSTSTTNATANNVDSSSNALGFSIDYVYPIKKLNMALALGLDVIHYQAKVDGFTESNVGNLLDSLDVHQQKSNGTAVVASVGVSGKYTKNLTFGADLRLTSYGSGKEHKVSANVAPEQTVFTVGHYGVGNSIFGLGLSAEYKINKDSALGFGLRFEGDDSMSDGFRGDINYRRRF
jgi:autotransporter-associated beta strand protein